MPSSRPTRQLLAEEAPGGAPGRCLPTPTAAAARGQRTHYSLGQLQPQGCQVPPPPHLEASRGCAVMTSTPTPLAPGFPSYTCRPHQSPQAPKVWGSPWPHRFHLRYRESWCPDSQALNTPRSLGTKAEKASCPSTALTWP